MGEQLMTPKAKLIPVLAVLGVLIGAACVPQSAWSIIVPILGHSSPSVTYISPIYYDQLAHPNWDAYTGSSSPTVRSFFLAHVGRIFTFTPYFDDKLSWYPYARVYVDISVIYSTDTATVAAHPDWVLRDGGGVALFNPSGVGGGTGPEYAANIGSAAFRASKIAGIGSALAGVSGMAPTPYLGFFLDDVNTDITVTDGFGTPVTPIDTNTGVAMTQNAWSGYMVTLVQGIRATYPATELTQNSVWFSDALSSDITLQIAASDRIFCERGFGDTGLSGGPGGSLRAFMDYVDTVHAAGKPVNIDDYFVSNLHYSTAGYLLGWAPGDHLEFDDLLPDPAVWPSVLFDMPLGTPTAARFQPNSGTYPRLWRRDYQNGVALLNEPGAGSITYPLGATYQDETGTTMTSITLGAMQGAVLQKVSAPAGGPVLLSHVGKTGSGTSTAAINTTGATLLTCGISGDTSTYTVTDSGGNTWVAGTPQTNIVTTVIYYSYNKAGGALSLSGSHTFTATTTGGFLAFECAAWAGTRTGATNPFDTETGGTGNVIPTHSGTLTPGAGSHHLILSSFGENNTAGFMSGASASGMAVTDTNSYAGGVNYGGSLAYTVQPGAATAIDTGWTPIGSAGCNCAVAIMSFKAP